ncbi:unnamed protein product [Discosporangium mesarthrocarpum]
MLPPRGDALDVGAVEVARVLRLTTATVEPVSFFLPRSNNLKDFFQDDVYRPVRSADACLSSSEWLSGGNPGEFGVGQRFSLQPAGGVGYLVISIKERHSRVLLGYKVLCIDGCELGFLMWLEGNSRLIRSSSGVLCVGDPLLVLPPRRTFGLRSFEVWIYRASFKHFELKSFIALFFRVSRRVHQVHPERK